MNQMLRLRSGIERKFKFEIHVFTQFSVRSRTPFLPRNNKPHPKYPRYIDRIVEEDNIQIQPKKAGPDL